MQMMKKLKTFMKNISKTSNSVNDSITDNITISTLGGTGWVSLPAGSGLTVQNPSYSTTITSNLPYYTYTPASTSASTTSSGNVYGTVGAWGNTITSTNTNYQWWTDTNIYSFSIKIPGKEDIEINKVIFSDVLRDDKVETCMILSTYTVDKKLSESYKVGEKFEFIHVFDYTRQGEKKRYLYSLQDCIVSRINKTEERHSPTSITINTSPMEEIFITYKKKEVSPKFEEWFKVVR